MVVVADGAFASVPLLSEWTMRRRCIICVTRLRLDARLFRPAPPRKPGATGRPRLIGTRLPSLQQVLVNRHTQWQQLLVDDWYGQGQRLIELTPALPCGIAPVSRRCRFVGCWCEIPGAGS